MNLNNLVASCRPISRLALTPSHISQSSRCVSHFVNPSYNRIRDARAVDYEKGFSIRSGTLLHLVAGNSVKDRCVDFKFAGKVATFHTSNADLAPEKKGVPWEVRLTDKMKASWRASSIYPFWEKNEFLNRYFLETFGLKLKHFIVTFAVIFPFCFIPYGLELFQVATLIVMFYFLKGKKFL